MVDRCTLARTHGDQYIEPDVYDMFISGPKEPKTEEKYRTNTIQPFLFNKKLLNKKWGSRNPEKNNKFEGLGCFKIDQKSIFEPPGPIGIDFFTFFAEK